MHANKKTTDRFLGRSENYAKYRPSYPRDLIDYLFITIGFSGASIIADVGSGTGIFSSLLLERGLRVIGIEPNEEMRGKAEKLLEQYPAFWSINGTAEATGLPNNSVDHIICAQAFHWFNRDACQIEFSRILKDQGNVVLVWNRRLVEARGFSSEYEELLKTYANDYSKDNRKSITDKEFARFYKAATYDKVTFASEELLDLTGLEGRLLSSSYAPLPGEQNHDILIRELRNLFNKYCTNGMLLVKYETDCYVGEV